jgi:hypothetical protein
MPSTASAAPSPTHGVFGLFCLGSYLLSVSYGTTFLLAMVLSAHGGQTAQSLVLFSLAYFVGVFGFPWLAGHVIVNYGIPALLSVILLIALCNWSITLGRLLWRRLALNDRGSPAKPRASAS